MALEDILKVCGKGSAKGLKTSIFVAGLEEVTAIPAPDDYPTTGDPHTISSDLTMRASDPGPPAVAAGTFKEFRISKIDHSYECTPEGDQDSTGRVTEVKFFIPGITPQKTYVLDDMAGCEYFAIVTDKEGQRRLLGDLEDGCEFSYIERTNDKAGYEVTIRWESKAAPYFYKGTIVQ